ncbi:dsDNA nuclease domain-containing protein [Gemmatimonadota bacterium]
MPKLPLIDPPDDTGSDTFQRYRYQARVAVPYCLACILDQGVLAVYSEHIEDIVIQYDNSKWTFIQVKTRNPSRGPWKLTDILKPSGGIESLLRSYKAVQNYSAAFTLELHLEGTLCPEDLIKDLCEPRKKRSDDVIKTVAEKLDLQDSECAVFLSVLTVREAIPRSHILAENNRLIGNKSPHLTIETIRTIQEGIVEELSKAMEKTKLGEDWPKYILDSNAGPSGTAELVEAKKLDSSKLEWIRYLLEPTSKHMLLSDSTVEGQNLASTLESKLRLGNARESLIALAKCLRSNASRREAEILAKGSLGLTGQKRLEDVRIRLISTVEEVKGNPPESSSSPASRIFSGLRDTLKKSIAEVDPHRIFGRDCDLLLGEICELSDQCETDWSLT